MNRPILVPQHQQVDGGTLELPHQRRPVRLGVEAAPRRARRQTNSRCPRLSSVTSAANGQPIPAAVARRQVFLHRAAAMPSSRPIARVLAPAPKCNASNCRIRRMVSLSVGIPSLHRLRWRHWTPGHR